MSRSGYSEECEQGALNFYRANVDRTIAGKRGQTFLREMAAALDAMPVKELIAGEVVRDEAHVCAIGAVAVARKADVSKSWTSTTAMRWGACSASQAFWRARSPTRTTSIVPTTTRLIVSKRRRRIQCHPRRPSNVRANPEPTTVAALFVEKGGSYYDLPGVDPWDVERDARKYHGPHPVVAHPPCQLWVNFAALNFKRYGGEHNRPGNDGGCFSSALASVRRWGGVLEHPASSKAWAAHGLTEPYYDGWKRNAANSEWTCEVWQSAYGHAARKRTWLLFVGDFRPGDLDWTKRPGVAQVGWFDRNKPTLSKRQASATPPTFRDMILDLARRARPSVRKAI